MNFPFSSVSYSPPLLILIFAFVIILPVEASRTVPAIIALSLKNVADCRFSFISFSQVNLLQPAVNNRLSNALSAFASFELK